MNQISRARPATSRLRCRLSRREATRSNMLRVCPFCATVAWNNEDGTIDSGGRRLHAGLAVRGTEKKCDRRSRARQQPVRVVVSLSSCPVLLASEMSGSLRLLDYNHLGGGQSSAGEQVEHRPKSR